MAKLIKQELKKQLITKEMTFADVLSKYPATAEIMLKYGLHCIGCHIAAIESIEQGARGHGLQDYEIDEMLEEMNEKADNTPEESEEESEEDDEEE
jgi:hybrid cluster-associated redox disulfide protein